MADHRKVTPPNGAVHTAERARLGVLLVHGIGVQRPGETVVTVADTLQSWLNRWYKQDGMTVSVDEASLVAMGTDPAPARARLVFHDKPGKPVAAGDVPVPMVPASLDAFQRSERRH